MIILHHHLLTKFGTMWMGMSCTPLWMDILPINKYPMILRIFQKNIHAPKNTFIYLVIFFDLICNALTAVQHVLTSIFFDLLQNFMLDFISNLTPKRLRLSILPCFARFFIDVDKLT